MTNKYTPKIGDVIKIWIGENVGSEQRGYRPHVIVVTNIINGEIVLINTCAVTRKRKGLEMEVPFSINGKEMVALAVHLNTIDPRALERKVKFIGTMPAEQLQALRLKLSNMFLTPQSGTP